MADIVVRWAGPGDAAAIARMLNALNVYVGCEDGLFSEAQVLDHFFGERRVVSVLLAEAEGRSVGLATLIDFYNSDRATFSLWLNDLYVEEAWRSSGAGRKLMAAAAKEALARGGDSLWWGVLDENRRAIAFYDRLGASKDEAHILELEEASLRQLAAEA
ncbi:MAG: GNAT family N-acetyltransferase [Limibacillus sp.]